ncbi:helix-turn-helix domain-containing protein [Halosimplex rubrum]|uniref:Helix-turn-helix domain-containing protein n=1 Tax=Halosimplex rubrum TaxID=869889 RepID=A0A7D5P1G5_9EURY|nr:helix-turn-helix domain-containing protein [Halosimplex rubrum]QLH78317.1 helix-turn-helix domain-containing protein [Halosimplex rubrum]
MSFIAEFCVEIPPLSQASTAVPEMQFSGQDIVLEANRPRKFIFTALGTQFDDFENGLEADPTVVEYTRLTKSEETAHYVVTYDTAATSPDTYSVAVEHDISYHDIKLQDGEYTVRARVPDRSSLVKLREHCQENGIPFRLERIYQETGSNFGTHGLTDAQQEAVKLAYENGYFDSPRQSSLKQIADEIGISPQAVGRVAKSSRVQ